MSTSSSPGPNSGPRPRSIVWITGWPGCGKTTAGDYLEKYYGYVNIDVDDQFILPRFEDGKPNPDDPLLAGYLKSWGMFFGGEVPLEEDFGPFLEETVLARIKQLLLANISNNKERDDVRIVVTQGIHREGRDWFAKRLYDETGESIFYVGLAASLRKKMLRLRGKVEQLTEAQNAQEVADGKPKKTYAESFKERTGKELTDINFEQDWNEQNAKRIPLMSKMDIDPDEIEAHRGWNVSLDDGDEKVLPSLKEALNLQEENPQDENFMQEILYESQEKLQKFARMKKM